MNDYDCMEIIEKSINQVEQINYQNLSNHFQCVGHFNQEDYVKNLSPTDSQYKKIILAKMVQMNEWASSYLGQPHEDLGRLGPVCPFVPLSIKKKLFLITHYLCHKETTFEELKGVMHHYKVYFQQLMLNHSNYVHLNSIMIVFVSIDNQSAYLTDLIDGVQKELKPDFIKDKTMIGQFYDDCGVQGIHNKSFKPFDAPVPTLAIRKFMPQDLVFVTDSKQNMQLYIDEFNIQNDESLMKLLKSVCLDKNKNVLSHAEVLLKNLETRLNYEPNCY